MQAKPVSFSQVTLADLMLPQHANPYYVVHGGEIMKMMDNTGGAVAHRHAHSRVVTARVDELEFLLPIPIGSLVSCHGKMTFVGNASMEVALMVTVVSVTQDEPDKTAVTGYFTFVALDKDARPQPVPPLELTTDEERQLFEAGRQRYLAYKQRRSSRLQVG